MKKLYRSRESSVIAGLCGGVGEYFNIDPVIVRILFILSGIWGVGILLYVIGWVIVPLREYNDSGQVIDSEQEGMAVNKNAKYFPGLILILIGACFLFVKFWHWISFYYLFSILIIVVGVILIYRAVTSDKEGKDES